MFKQYSLVGLTLVMLITALYVSWLIQSYPGPKLSAIAMPTPIQPLKKIIWDIEPNNNPFVDQRAIINQHPFAGLTLAQLHLLGVIQVQHRVLALIQTPDKKIHRLSIGDEINPALGYIVAINGKTVYLKAKNQAVPQPLTLTKVDAS